MNPQILSTALPGKQASYRPYSQGYLCSDNFLGLQLIFSTSLNIQGVHYAAMASLGKFYCGKLPFKTLQRKIPFF